MEKHTERRGLYTPHESIIARRARLCVFLHATSLALTELLKKAWKIAFKKGIAVEYTIMSAWRVSHPVKCITTVIGNPSLNARGESFGGG